MLEGIRIVDLTAMGPGPRCSRILADYGAAIVKILAPAKGPAVGPPRAAYGWYRGIDRLTVDMKAPEGLAVVRRLAAEADVVLESFRPGVARRLGVGYDDLRGGNPGLVYGSITGYGQDGPYAGWPGHDLNWLGMAGFLALSGRTSEDLPALPGGVVADGVGGMCAALAVMGALVQRGRTGAGAHLDIAVLEAVLRLTYVPIDQYLGVGEPQEHGKGELWGGAPYYGVYRTSDDRFVTVAAIEPAFFAQLCRGMGLDDFAADQHRADRRDALRRALTARFESQTRDEWVHRLAPLDTCVAPVYEIHEIASDPHIQARGLVWEVQHEELGTVSQIVPSLTGASKPVVVPVLRDLRSTDPEAVLAAAGIDGAQLERLRASGAVG